MSTDVTRRKRRVRRIKRMVLALAALSVVLLAARSSLARMVVVGGASDAPTVLLGDRLWINLAAYDLWLPFTNWRLANWADPERGDMVLCRVPGRNNALLKRVVAVGEDSVELRDNRLLINGQAARYEALDPGSFQKVSTDNRMGDCVAVERISGVSRMISYDTTGSPVSNYGPITVPAGHYFVLGDNRDNSYDSRTEACGWVPRAEILGRLIGQGRRCP